MDFLSASSNRLLIYFDHKIAARFFRVVIMKKTYLLALGLIFIAPVSSFGQLYLRVETAPSIFLSPKNAWSIFYLNPYQIYYRSGQFLRYRIDKRFYLGIGFQQETLNGCIECLKYRKPNWLAQLSYDMFYVKAQDSCVASSRGMTSHLNIPLEIGYTYRRKKSPWGINLNTRINLYTYSEQNTKFRGDTVKMDIEYKGHEWIVPRFIDLNMALGISYRANKRVFISADLGTQITNSRSRFIGLNIGLDYALIKP